MSFTKNNKIICNSCGKFCIPFDEETPFGCNNPELPEPLDPYHYCENCFNGLKEKFVNSFKKGCRYGYWQKSRAEIEAAKECDLIWVGSDGIGDFKKGTYINYRYITKEEYNLLTNLT